MVYIIKAKHTNEGQDEGVSDSVIDYVDGKIIDTTTSTDTVWSRQKTSDEIDALISDTTSSTTSTYSSAKIDEKYDDKVFGYTGGDFALEIQLDDRKIDIEIVDNCGGKIELLGNGAVDTSVNYRFIKVLRLSYGNWTEFDATKPNDTYTKIKEVYVDTTNKKAYVHLKGNANYIVKGAKSVISKNYADVDTSTMTLIPESNWGSISDSSTSTVSTWSSSKIATEIDNAILTKDIIYKGALTANTRKVIATTIGVDLSKIVSISKIFGDTLEGWDYGICQMTDAGELIYMPTATTEISHIQIRIAYRA